MLDVHIDDFWNDCAAVLLHGMRVFPRLQTLYVEDISGPDDVDEFGLHSDRHLAALGAIQWLKDEGYIRFSSFDRQESVDDFVLTSKAFNKLMALVAPESLAGDPSSQYPSANSTAVFQALEFARLQRNSLWLGRLMQEHIL